MKKNKFSIVQRGENVFVSTRYARHSVEFGSHCNGIDFHHFGTAVLDLSVRSRLVINTHSCVEKKESWSIQAQSWTKSFATRTVSGAQLQRRFRFVLREKMENSDDTRKWNEMVQRIEFLRNFSVFFMIASTALMTCVALFTTVLTNDIKTWMLSIVGVGFLAVTVSLFLARRDTTITLFIVYIASMATGLMFGLSLISIAYQIKHG